MITSSSTILTPAHPNLTYRDVAVNLFSVKNKRRIVLLTSTENLSNTKEPI